MCGRDIKRENCLYQFACEAEYSICVFFVHACQGVLSWLWHVVVGSALTYFILTLIFIWSPLFYILPPFKKKFQDTSISSWQSSAFFPPIQQACCWIFKHQHFHLLWLDIVILGNLNTLEVFSNLVWFDQCPSLTLKAQKKVFQAP